MSPAFCSLVRAGEAAGTTDPAASQILNLPRNHAKRKEQAPTPTRSKPLCETPNKVQTAVRHPKQGANRCARPQTRCKPLCETPN
ncbi:hypothetical protein GDO81_027904 [Engystomops pustulosus]|uniref:Uncharacterized protein n=1 Tax=Engystomops pustulosus TaxID=76066 RepID=A0AAV6YNX1_ENGPU|nr:hypothetical protein GDO81_027904 [Engystomops pustulosus]